MGLLPSLRSKVADNDNVASLIVEPKGQKATIVTYAASSRRFSRNQHE